MSNNTYNDGQWNVAALGDSLSKAEQSEREGSRPPTSIMPIMPSQVVSLLQNPYHSDFDPNPFFISSFSDNPISVILSQMSTPTQLFSLGTYRDRKSREASTSELQELPSANQSSSGDSGIYMLPEDCEIPHICIFCSRHFHSATDLSRHERVHKALRRRASDCSDYLEENLTIYNKGSIGARKLAIKRNYNTYNTPTPLTNGSPSLFGCVPSVMHNDITDQEEIYNSLTMLPTLENQMPRLEDPSSFNKTHTIDFPKHITHMEFSYNKHGPIIPSECIDLNDSGSSFSEYETDLEEDNVIDSIQDLDLCTTSPANGNLPTGTHRDMIRNVLSQMQEGGGSRSPIDTTREEQCQEALDAGDIPEGSKSEQSCPTLQPPSSQRTTWNSRLKRMNEQQNSQDDGNDDDRNLKRRITLPSPPQDATETFKLGCPYRKHNPGKYSVRSWRSCALTPLETVARVKAHLYRYHRIFPCQRCKTQFKNQEQVNQHLKEPEPCPLREVGEGEGDGLTSNIVERLKSKKKSDKHQSEGDRWREIYRLLFPHDMVPDPSDLFSKYFEVVQENHTQSPDSRELANYEEFCRHELPHSIRAALEEIILNESHPIEEILRNRLVTIIRDCQDKVFSRYRESTTTNVASPLRTRTESSSSIITSPTLASDGTSFSNDLADTTPASHSVPSFFQPPPPQAHLGTHRLGSTALQFNSRKPTSDSGYASNYSELPPYSSIDNEEYSPKLDLKPPPPSKPDPVQLQHSHSVLEAPSSTDWEQLLIAEMEPTFQDFQEFQISPSGFNQEMAGPTISSDFFDPFAVY